MMSADGMLGRLTPIFLNALDALPDSSLAEPTALPGWTRAHVVVHVHSNAEALRRLLHWARTGEETAMYPSPTYRNQEIETFALLDPPTLRALVHASAVTLVDDLARLTPEQRRTTVVTAQGRRLPAGEIAWLRCREVGVHAVDLDAGVGFSALPDDFLTALIHDVLAKRAAGGELPRLAAWLTGRGHTDDPIGPWL
jgi:maleylpyruvate isomerase